MPVIIAILEAEIGRITVQNQIGIKAHKTPSQPIRSWAQLAPVIPTKQETSQLNWKNHHPGWPWHKCNTVL
jgi:hypothetical protein